MSIFTNCFCEAQYVYIIKMLSEKVVWCYRHEAHGVKITKRIVNSCVLDNCFGMFMFYYSLVIFWKHYMGILFDWYSIYLFDKSIICLFG